MNKKNLWPYGLTIVIFLYVGWLLFFIVFSNTQKADFVEDNYYQKGLDYQQQIDRMQRTKELNGDVQLVFKPRQKLQVRLPVPAEQGTIALYRPANSRLDRRYELQTDADNQQELDISGLQKGKWIVKIVWQSGGASYYFEHTLIVE